MPASQRLTLAIQKKGRLSEDSMGLLKNCGLKLTPSKSSLFYSCANLPIDVLLVRDDDIPGLIRDGICDLGIVGENVLQELELANQQLQFERTKALPFGRCRLSIAIPRSTPYDNLYSLQNKRIATSYPNLLQHCLATAQIDTTIVTMSGSVEIAPRCQLADAVCDLVSTGKTLEENNLQEVQVVLESQAVLVKMDKKLSEGKSLIFERLLRRIEGVLQAGDSKYILFHAPKSAINTIKQLLPGSELPSIVPLAECEDKVAVHVVSREGVFWSTLENLRSAGANCILVLPIEKMML